MPEIHYYVVRQGDDAEERFVPMIPIDQMPDWLEIVGVPRTLHAEDAAKMTALLDIGRKGGARGTFQARLLMNMPGEASPPASASASTAAATLITSSAAATSPTSPTSSAATLETRSPSTHAAADKEGSKRGNGTESSSSRATNKSNGENTGILLEDTARRWEPAATATKPLETGAVAKLASDSDVPSSAKSEDQDHSDKTDDTLPCKYWCRYGRCGFKTRCRFAHVMPLTREGLALVDLDELPQWYVKKKNTPADSQSNSNSNSSRSSLGCNDLNKPNGRTRTLAASKKTFKIQRTTVISSSPCATKRDGGWRCSPAPRETHMSKPTVPAADNARDVEVGDLIDLI